MTNAPPADARLDALAKALPAGAIVTDRDVVALFRQDWAKDPAAGWPLAVVRPTCTADVQATLGWANTHGIPVVTRGAGSGLSGGATAVEGGILLSLELMREVTVDPLSRIAVSQAGALTGDVKRAAAQHGLWYPPDPSSYEMSTIGGNAATNAGGLCCVKYGVTTDYVLGMEIVLADGTAMRLGGPRLKDAAGFSLTKLFVGSEGALAVITELTLRLLPTPPTGATLVATMPSVDAAARAVLAITTVVRPSMLELMDRTAINAVEDLTSMGLDRTAGALLLARSDAPGSAAADEIAFMEAACSAQGATEMYATDDPLEAEALAAARRLALPAVERLGSLLLEDVGVALPDLPELLRGFEDIAQQHAVTIAVIAHAGDGNTHPLIVFDPADANAAQRAHAAFAAVMQLALDLDGTITGEHGVGRLKRTWLPAYLGDEALALTRRIKHALDPNGILNPGVVLELGLPSDSR